MNLENVDPAATFELIAHRLMDAAAAAINLANVFALIGAVFFVATLLMRTIVPLRIAALISNVFFIAYGVLANSINAPSFCIACYCPSTASAPVPDDQAHQKGPGLSRPRADRRLRRNGCCGRSCCRLSTPSARNGS
jgi:hypothetical protein